MAITTLNNRSINRSDTATSGQVWTATSATAADFQAAGGAWNLIKSQSITSTTASMLFIDGTSDVTFDNSYKLYVLVVTDYLPSTNEESFQIQITTDTGSSYKTSGHYTIGYESYYDVSNQGSQQIVTQTSMIMRNHVGSASAEQLHGQIWMYNPSATASYPTMGYQMFFGRGGDDKARHIHGVGAYQTAGAYDGFKIFSSSGNIENLQASLYGITT
jgi:hypothetical protein